jgi:hypothetical protein
MITAKQCLEKFGPPETEKFLVVWDVPPELEIGFLPNKIYCHKFLVKPLSIAFGLIISRGLVDEVKSWDGCFNIRNKRGALSSSIHSWALAIDLNAAWNRFGQKPTMSKELVACFKEAGFDWGGDWSKPDGMHFQLSYLP